MNVISTSLNDLANSVDMLEGQLKSVQDRLAGWTRGNETNPSFDFLKADQARFYYPPLESARYRRVSALAVGAWNTIVWDEETWNFSPVYQTTASTGLFRYRHLEGLAELMFTGFIRWQGNSSGERLLRFNEYTTNGVLRKKISDAAPILSADIGELAAPFTFIHHVNPKSSGFDFQVWQNGESPSLNVNFAYLGIIKFLRREVTDSTKVLIIQPPTQNTFVSQADPNTTGSNSTLIVRTSENTPTGGAYSRRSYLQFNLIDIPAGADILSADLELMVTTRADNTSVANSIQIYRAASSWTAGTLTWATQPAAEDLMGSTAEGAGKLTWATFALSTAEFAAMISSNYGMRVRFSNEDIGSTHGERYDFFAESAEPFFERKPRLIVRYLEA